MQQAAVAPAGAMGTAPANGPTEPSPSSFPAPDAASLSLWFPALSRMAVARPSMRLLCFHAAGCAEDMYSSEGTGARRAPSPLLEWARQNEVEVLAVQLPGRGTRLREAPVENLHTLAATLLPLLASRLSDGVPYAVVSHSMGAWAAYELLEAAKKRGLPMPVRMVVGAMPAPDIPMLHRPWRQQRRLGEEEFKAECRAWDINEVVFSASMWPMYHPMLRADFKLFDEYEFDGGATVGGPLPFDFPITAFYGTGDRRVSKEMVQGWQRFTSSGDFACCEVGGNHLWPLDKDAKRCWLEAIVGELKQTAGSCSKLN